MSRIPRILRSISVLATGTALGQLISLLTIPVVTRLYTPADYGVLGMFSSIVTVLGGIAGLRFDAALLLPERNISGRMVVRKLFRITIVTSLVVSASLLILATIIYFFWGFEPLDSLGGLVFLLPIGVLLTSVSATFSALAVRDGTYRQLGRVPLVQKFSSGLIQILGGFTGAGALGLIAGALLQPIVSIGMLVRGRSRFVRISLHRRGISGELHGLISEYRDFPLINAPTVLLNLLAWNSQILILSFFYSTDDIGLYSLALGVVGLPLNVILSAVSQVYLRESANRKGDRLSAQRIFKQLLIGLLLISVPIFGLLWAGSEYGMEPAFGAEWAGAGLIAQAMLPLLWGRFMATTLTTTFTVYRRQSWLLLWQISALLATGFGYIFGGISEFTIAETVFIASSVSLLLYILIIPMSYYAIKVGNKRY